MKSPIYIISLYLQYINILNIHVLVKVYSGLIANNTKIFDVVKSFPHITWNPFAPKHLGLIVATFQQTSHGFEALCLTKSHTVWFGKHRQSNYSIYPRTPKP